MTDTQTHHAKASRGLQFSGLDLLRFAAALIVMFYHLGLVVAATRYRLVNVSYRALAPCAWPGWIGVEIFFTLSGFIISFSAQGATAASFAKGRFIRLYPAAWVCATITAIVLLVTHTAKLGAHGARIARTLGLMTYPLYLLHQENGYRLLIVLHSHIPDPAALIGVMAALIALSYLVHAYAERPIQHWFREHLFTRRRPIASHHNASINIAATHNG